VNEILFRAQIPLGGLERRVAQEQLDLLQLAPGGPAELRSGPSAITRRDAGDSGSLGEWPEHLPDHLFGKDLALHLVGSMDRPENVSVRHAAPNSPGINRYFHPNWHPHSPHARVLPEEIHDAPPAIALLDMARPESRHLGPA
jgi:hypothetical protein